MATRNLAAVDLGAESGRIILARFDGAHIALEEVHRFPNRPVFIRGHRIWNVLTLWEETLVGLRRARQLAGQLDSVGVDTWAVDYGLVDRTGLLVSQPYSYRDHRIDGVMEQVCAVIPREQIYARTGIQFLPFNTLYQLSAHEQLQPGALAHAHRLLMMPDLFHSWLSGSFASERTNATTTQCWDPIANRWATDVLEAVALPISMLPQVVESGTDLGAVLPELRNDLGAPRVIAPATHDTGSAIAALPAQSSRDWGYISSGTWSLVGVELARPLMTEAALAANFTNEGGVFGTTRFLKNVMGMWLLNECQRHWSYDGQAEPHDRLDADVESAEPFAALIDPDDRRFFAPQDMPATINGYLRERGQPPLTTHAGFARCIMESLVLRYGQVFAQAAHLTGTRIRRVHVVGGGSRNLRMNQWLADALDVPVVAGPAEATALGNALMQLVGLGELGILEDVRRLARATPTAAVTPRAGAAERWREASARFAALTSL